MTNWINRTAWEMDCKDKPCNDGGGERLVCERVIVKILAVLAEDRRRFLPSLQDPVLAIHHPSPSSRAMRALIIKLHNKLIPIRVITLNQVYLPLTRPPLHRFLLGNCISNKVMTSKPNESARFIFGRKAIKVDLGLMLLNPLANVTGHAQIKCAVLSIADEINITIAHSRNLQEMDCKNKSCNDGGG